MSSLFKTINGIAIVLISAMLIWMAATLTELNARVAVLVAQNHSVAAAAADNRRIRDREHDLINERLSKVEDHASNGHGER